MTNRWTPDGYQVGPDGAWMVNGQEVTRPYTNGMGRETNWYSFGGNYHVRSLQYTSGVQCKKNSPKCPGCNKSYYSSDYFFRKPCIEKHSKNNTECNNSSRKVRL